MGSTKYLNLGNTGVRRIYRIMSARRLFEMFRNRENVLVAPTRWRDPWEACGKQCEGIFGQCWTLEYYSDAMWRLYSPAQSVRRPRLLSVDRCAVRVRSTIESVGKGMDSIPSGHGFVGRVSYSSEKQLLEIKRKSLFESGSCAHPRSAEAIANGFLVKRKAFRHESEVRLLWVADGDVENGNGKYRYPIDPHALLDQIMIDPRLRPDQTKEMKRRVQKETLFKGEILNSLLYAPPPIFVHRKSSLAGRQRAGR